MSGITPLEDTPTPETPTLVEEDTPLLEEE
jgi:hypothetical protein